MKSYDTLLLITLSLAACTLPVRDGGGPRTERVTPREERGIGVLAITGPNVTVARRPASNGMVVNEGEEVATGAASSAVLSYFVGGSIQLDENTDPISFKRIQAGLCILVKLFSGQAWVETEGSCGIRVETPDASADIHSKVNIVVNRERTGFTVISGRLLYRQTNLARTIPLKASQNIIIYKGQTQPKIDTLSTVAIADKIKWRSNYVVPKIRVPLTRVPQVRSTAPAIDATKTYEAPTRSINTAPTTTETSPATSSTTATIETAPATTEAKPTSPSTSGTTTINTAPTTTLKKVPAELPPPENLRVIE